MDKYRGRFGSGNKKADEVSLSSVTIEKEVDRLVGASVPITEANLSRLERRLQHKAHVSPADPDGDALSVVSISAYTTGSEAASRMGSMRGRSSRGHTPFSSAASRRGPLTSGRGVFSGGASSSSRTASTPRQRVAALGLGAVPERGEPHPALTSARGSSALSRAGGASGVGDGRLGSVSASSAPTSSLGEGVPQASLEWSVLDRLAGQLHKRDAALHKAKEQEIRQRLRHDLDKQVEDSQLKQEREKEEAKRYHNMQVDALHHWRQQEEATAIAKKALIKNTQLARDEQLGHKRSMREQQREAEKLEAQAELESFQHNSEKDQLQAETMWRKKRESAQKALAVSSQSARMRDAKARREEDLDHQLVLEHEQQMVEREQWVKQMEAEKKEAIESRSKAVFKEIAEAQKHQKKLPFESTPEEEANHTSMLSLREREERKRAAALRKDTQAYNLEQMRQKASAKLKEQSLKSQVRALQDMDARAHQHDMSMEHTQRRLQNSEHRHELERQIASKLATGPKGDVMSEAELRLNRDLLERVNRALTEISVPPSTAGTVRV